ncbi:YeeE/YedE family protein [Planctomycetales bacterium ZRK34]|nr:YeeE/YedE family protein [Planctomycetales bacterium ZRK34]
MPGFLRQARWSPYVVGAGLGVLSWITFGLMDKALGTSTSFVNLAGLIESFFAPQHVEQNAYLAKHMVDKPAINWQMMLVIGLGLGALISAKLGRSGIKEHVPDLWAWRFGPSRAVRYFGAFAGGVAILFGARLAGGCTSGHGISGSLQLAVGSWTFFACFFGAGIATALALYGKAGRRHV